MSQDGVPTPLRLKIKGDLKRNRTDASLLTSLSSHRSATPPPVRLKSLDAGFKNAQLVSDWSKSPCACARAHTGMGQGDPHQVVVVTRFPRFRSVLPDHATTALDTMADTPCLPLL